MGLLVPRERSRRISGEKRSLASAAAIRLIRIAALLPVFAAPVFGWGCEGHQTIALIARAHLSNAALQAVDQLLRDNPIDPSLSRFCKDRPADLMADSSTWADDVKNIERTGEWHYIDIPLSVTRETPDVSLWCAPIGPFDAGKDRTGCVVDAISYEWAILKDASHNGADRARALRYLIHFVGDLHQPLHAEDNDDRGGNCTAIAFFAEPRPANLHAIWDYKLIQHQLELDRQTQPQLAAALDRQFASHWTEWGQPKVDVIAWTWESHKLARDVSYGDLTPQIPMERPNAQVDCGAERDKVAAEHIAIGNAYYDATEPVIDQQLAKAGYRLAALLNQTFGE